MKSFEIYRIVKNEFSIVPNIDYFSMEDPNIAKTALKWSFYYEKRILLVLKLLNQQYQHPIRSVHNFPICPKPSENLPEAELQNIVFPWSQDV